jgi:tRNA 2-(methylsulfanyl)-N6-isopentenyladenosine37 hydroxylase
MLGLKLATDPRWVNIAEKTIEEVLIDHAYCEQKAATTCIAIIINYPEHKIIDYSLALTERTIM